MRWMKDITFHFTVVTAIFVIIFDVNETSYQLYVLLGQHLFATRTVYIINFWVLRVTFRIRKIAFSVSCAQTWSLIKKSRIRLKKSGMPKWIKWISIMYIIVLWYLLLKYKCSADDFKIIIRCFNILIKNKDDIQLADIFTA